MTTTTTTRYSGDFLDDQLRRVVRCYDCSSRSTVVLVEWAAIDEHNAEAHAEDDRLAEIAFHNGGLGESQHVDPFPPAWTVVVRRRTANRFRRTTFAGTWHEAVAEAARVAADHPEWEVHYVKTDDTSVLVESGRRVKIGSQR